MHYRNLDIVRHKKYFVLPFGAQKVFTKVFYELYFTYKIFISTYMMMT